MTRLLDFNEITYCSTSICDKIGRVFFYKDKIFREINSVSKDKIMNFLSSELYKELIVREWIPETKISDYSLGNGNIILEHQLIQMSKPSEWSFSMLKDAALFLLNLNSFLKSYGYNLWDGHLWNVCFYNNHPVFIDLGSIVPVEEGSWFEQEFIHCVAYPLLLWAENESYIAKALLSHPSNISQRTIPAQSIQDSLIVSKTILKFFCKLRLRYKLCNLKKLNQKLLKFNFIDKYIVPPVSNWTMWEDYQSDFFSNISQGNLHQRFIRFENIKNLVLKYCPDAQSCIDLAGNQGGFSFYLYKNCHSLKSIINIDYDETAIEKSYNYFKQNKMPVYTFWENFMLPRRYDFNKCFKSDIAFALAVTHHLTLAQGFHLSAVFETIKSYSNKYVFIEFMPWGLWGGGERPEVPEWYNFNWFKETFERYFTLLHVEDFGNNRILFIGKNKEK